MNPMILFVGIAVLVGLVAYLLLGTSDDTRAAQKRLKTFTEMDREAQHASTAFSTSAASAQASWGAAAKKKPGERGESLLTGGGNTKQQLFLILGVMIVCAVVMGLVAKGFLPRSVQNFLPLGILGLLVPRMFTTIKLGRIRRKFSEQFPPAIRMMMNSLRAGHDIRSSFGMVAEEMPSPIREEFAHILRELNVGVPIDTTLKNFENRLNMSDVKIFVMGVLMNNKLGGNLTEILQKLEHTMRERIRLRKEIKSLTSQAQASATILTVLVPFMSIMMFVIGREHMSVLWTTKMGIQILIGCYSMVGLGAFILFRMCSVRLE